MQYQARQYLLLRFCSRMLDQIYITHLFLNTHIAQLRLEGVRRYFHSSIIFVFQGCIQLLQQLRTVFQEHGDIFVALFRITSSKLLQELHIGYLVR
ncbi:hypothetical protein D3C87_1409430 [compost metagenome]